MTHREKAIDLKNTIKFLYEKEGRSKKYISKLLEIDYKIICNSINGWGLRKANNYLKPSDKKFLNKHRGEIKSMLLNKKSISYIAKSFGVNVLYMFNIIDKSEDLSNILHDNTKSNIVCNSSYEYIKLENEVWKPILGYEDYDVSNYGRVRKYIMKNRIYKMMALNKNTKTNRIYVTLYNKCGRQNLQVARLVGFNFVNGHNQDRNTINHKDLDVTNNHADNLEWVSQSENNKYSYDKGRDKSIPYKKNKKFKKIIVNNQYEFKTMAACAKFFNVSTTQMQRYIDKECNNDKIKSIEFVY